MPNLKARSYQKELLDGDDIPFADIRSNMQELNTINTYLGGHHITISGIKQILVKVGGITTITICEIGCGGGDNLKAITKWCSANSVSVSCIGIDIKEECTTFAQQQYPELEATWIASDYRDVKFALQPDIIFSSLFCHHFDNGSIVAMLQWMKANVTLGFFINDLHRHPLAYYSIKLITQIFSKSYLVKNDAPLSVARGFTKGEWQNFIKQAGLSGCMVQWKWAFRHLVVYCHTGVTA